MYGCINWATQTTHYRTRYARYGGELPCCRAGAVRGCLIGPVYKVCCYSSPFGVVEKNIDFEQFHPKKNPRKIAENAAHCSKWLDFAITFHKICQFFFLSSQSAQLPARCWTHRLILHLRCTERRDTTHRKIQVNKTQDGVKNIF